MHAGNRGPTFEGSAVSNRLTMTVIFRLGFGPASLVQADLMAC